MPILLFTDRAVDSAELPFEHRGDRRGWVGDGFDVDVGSGEAVMGSRIWTFRRSPLTSKTARSVEDAAREALEPLLKQKAIVRADVRAETPAGTSRLALAINLYGRDGSSIHAARFDDLWSYFDGISAPLAP